MFYPGYIPRILAGSRPLTRSARPNEYQASRQVYVSTWEEETQAPHLHFQRRRTVLRTCVRDGTVQVRAVVKPRFLEGLHPQGSPAICSLVEVLVLVGEDEGFGI
jgi:hypothetical protein